jgi:hypothetical protein
MGDDIKLDCLCVGDGAGSGDFAEVAISNE